MNISVQYELHIVIFAQSHNSLLKIDQVKAKGGITIDTHNFTSFYSYHQHIMLQYKKRNSNTQRVDNRGQRM